jgi:hypothetical protein
MDIGLRIFEVVIVAIIFSIPALLIKALLKAQRDPNNYWNQPWKVEVVNSCKCINEECK